MAQGGLPFMGRSSEQSNFPVLVPAEPPGYLQRKAPPKRGKELYLGNAVTLLASAGIEKSP